MSYCAMTALEIQVPKTAKQMNRRDMVCTKDSGQ